MRTRTEDPNAHRPRGLRRRRPLLYGAVVVAALIAGAPFRQPELHAARAEPPAASAVVQRGLFQIAIGTTGVVVPVEEVAVQPRTTGEIVALPVKIGQAVTRGQLLLEQDAGPASRTLNAALADELEAQARLRIARIRLDDLARQSGLSTVTVELARAEAGLRDAELARARNAVADARDRLAQTRLLAPIDGIVTAIRVHRGEWIPRAAVDQGTPALLISDLSRIVIEADVPEAQIRDLQLNLAATVALPAFPDRSLQGRIVAIAPSGRPRGEKTLFPIRIELEGDAGDAGRPGLSAVARIIAVEKHDVLLLDRRAIRATGSDYSAVLIEQEQQKPVRVKVGRTDGERYEILEGLREGDRVALLQ